MKRRLLKLGVFLLLGAIVNVAVAWVLSSLFPQARPHPSLGSEGYGFPCQLLDRVWGETQFHIAWPGFAINTIFYAAILWMLWIGPGKIRRFVRVRRGRCPACGYFIDAGACAASGGLCSECGARLPPH